MSDFEPDILLDVQERQCFYCHQDLHRSVEVDHFIPYLNQTELLSEADTTSAG